MRKVGIIGLGHVGATVALMIAQGGYVDELVLIDTDEAKVKSEEGDLLDAQSLLNFHTKIYVGDYADLADADVVLSTLGRIDLLQANGDRFTELRANVPSVKAVSAELKKSGFSGILIVTTNPNDVIVDLYYRETGFPHAKILGTGTYLDTARMKRQVGEALGIDARSVTGYNLGEHGNSQFTAWSTVRVADRPMTEIAAEKGLDLNDLAEKARWGGFTVFDGKKYTNVAIAAATVGLMNLVFEDAHNVAICSHYSVESDSYISTPAIIGKNGVEEVLALQLTADEEAQLKKSMAEIKEKSQKFA
ncbi:MAG: L-lactate dehydrogenase [Streptococcaceae bacterium]|jgi:L-lactate dehydrogenase|nr:L-lactate dehydrogenase [Streptococcaceae bacterium]